jgi:uncharacterized iron-regulated protein
MKLQLAVSFCLLLIVTALPAQDDATTGVPESTPRIEDCRTGVDVDLKQLVSKLDQCDVLFLGEQHDNDSGHEFQLNVIRELVDRGRAIAISTEQFERDVQGSVDDYLSGRIDEEQFRKVSRPWPNYEKHYRPIIEFAKEHNIPVLAANVPRRIATNFSEGKDSSSSDRAFVPRSSTAPQDDYWQNFEETMQGHVGVEGADNLKKFYASQCLKDDGMAETITDYLAKNSHQAKTVVHLCGHFHSDYGLGTVARVVQRYPLARVTVVTMELQTVAESADPHSRDKGTTDLEKVRARAHYVFWSVKNREDDKDSKSDLESEPDSP